MKPASFAYERAETLAHALELLGEHGEEAKLIAGGQSLVAVMNLRLAAPEMLIDIDRLPGLSYVLPADGALRIGALTRHRQLERYPGPLPGFELLPRSAAYIGHYPIRTRGTFGGSIAHADPAAEWVLLATLLDADITVARSSGTRSVAARDFFEGFWTTTLEPDEMITEVTFPSGTGHAAIAEFARRHGDFAVVSAAVAFDRADDMTVTTTRIALGGVSATAVRLIEAPMLLDGTDLGDPTAAAAMADQVAAAAASEIDDPREDAHGDATYRRHLVRTLVRRALSEAFQTTAPAEDIR